MPKKFNCSYVTKLKLANALKELMMTMSFEKITVLDITEKCNIHRQTFYYHFQDRYELLDWLLYNEIVEPLTNDFTLDNMYEKLFDMFQTMASNKKFYINALKINANDLSRYISRVATQQFTEVIKNVKNDTNINKTTENDDIILAEFFGYGISGVVLGWVQNGMKETPKEMTSRIENIVASLKILAIQRTTI
jgi:probable dihydroxyacetone kinase regulator